MPLKGLDIVAALELASCPSVPRSYAELAKATGLSASEANQAARRGALAGLLLPGATRFEKPRVQRRALLSFLEHGVARAFFASPGRVVRGVPTAHSAPPLDRWISAGEELAFVWPDPDGPVRGRAIEPLHPSAPRLASTNPRLYELLALVDALRVGDARERKLALKELEARLTPEATSADQS
ncbi:MAG: hypothetical protein NTV21_12780 [Planctomycetota bacterium]|nr:hypothetical protein [Planctomycetota bacterium]